MPLRLSDLKILIRGAGDIATGVACRLHGSGFFRILMTEIEKPLAVRRTVSFCEAVYEKSCAVEGVGAELIYEAQDVHRLWGKRLVAVLVDPTVSSRFIVQPDILIDAILAKKNEGTAITDASLVIALGPGFCAGRDVHYVVETNRGHNLGRLISEGYAAPDTGIPGEVLGHSVRRVLRSPADGIFQSALAIGAHVTEGQVIGDIAGQPVRAALTGVLRGLIRPGSPAPLNLKIGDIDPRDDPSYCSTISEKARAIGGAVLEAMLRKCNT
jgi:xanthine dehydrogenase accessory factor